MGLEAQGSLSWSALQFKSWYEPLVGQVENFVEEEDVVKGREAPRERTIVFEVEASSCTTCELPKSSSYPLVMRFWLIPVPKYAINVSGIGLRVDARLGRVDHMIVWYVTSAPGNYEHSLVPGLFYW